MIDPRLAADRLIHDIDRSTLTVDQKLELIHALLELSNAEHRELRNLFTALDHADQIGDAKAKLILRAIIRRRIRVLPPPPESGPDGLNPNGGA